MRGWTRATLRFWHRVCAAEPKLPCGFHGTLPEYMILPGALVPSRTCPIPRTSAVARSFVALAHTGVADPPTPAVRIADQSTANSRTNGQNGTPTPPPTTAEEQPSTQPVTRVRKPRPQRGGQLLDLSGDKSLDNILGVGPVTVEKLRSKGHDSIKSLADLYSKDFASNQLRLVDYLKVPSSPSPCSQYPRLLCDCVLQPNILLLNPCSIKPAICRKMWACERGGSVRPSCISSTAGRLSRLING